MTTTTHAPLTARKTRAAKAPKAAPESAPIVEEITAPVKAAKAPKAVKPATDKKPQAAKKGGKKAPAVVATPVIGFTITNRPASGVILFAYTEAALQLLGMYDGKAIHPSMIKKVMGETAIRYHLGKGTFEKDDSGKLCLTTAGKAFFAERNLKAQEEHVAAFRNMMITGEQDGIINKNTLQVIKVS